MPRSRWTDIEKRYVTTRFASTHLRHTASFVLLFSACDTNPESAADAAPAHETCDAQVRIDDSSGKPICASETAYPGVTGDSTCSLPAPSAADIDKVNLTLRIGGARVLVFNNVADAASCRDLQAWHYDAARNPSKIVLCPQTCSLATSDPDSQLQVVAGCDTRRAQTDAGCAPAPR